MLYILNKPGEEALRQMAVIGADDDEKAVLLVSDAVFLGTKGNLKRFADMDVEDFYASKDSVEARDIELSNEVDLVDYDGMAGLMEDHAKIVTL